MAGLLRPAVAVAGGTGRRVTEAAGGDDEPAAGPLAAVGSAYREAWSSLRGLPCGHAHDLALRHDLHAHGMAGIDEGVHYVGSVVRSRKSTVSPLHHGAGTEAFH